MSPTGQALSYGHICRNKVPLQREVYEFGVRFFDASLYAAGYLTRRVPCCSWFCRPGSAKVCFHICRTAPIISYWQVELEPHCVHCPRKPSQPLVQEISATARSQTLPLIINRSFETCSCKTSPEPPELQITPRPLPSSSKVSQSLSIMPTLRSKNLQVPKVWSK